MFKREGRSISSYPEVKGFPTMAVGSYTRKEMKGYIREKHQVPENYEVVIKQGYVTNDESGQKQKLFGGLVAALLLVGSLAFLLSSCDDPDEKERLEDEQLRARLEAERQRDALLRQGVTHYEIIASGNENICDRCAEMNGQVFPIEEFAVGSTAPPFHPNCGCDVKSVAADVVEDTDPIELHERTETNIAALHPDIQEAVRLALVEMQSWEMSGSLRPIGQRKTRTLPMKEALREYGAATVTINTVSRSISAFSMRTVSI